ncbi:extracellular solute-binding protein [Enterovirga sp.]|jgi:multiple sugar transport system substrate-binding protein|uniref:ABC transporter substrate-binding protein n=1 Tax=Enterovirga sp. TaxID=2026350 RepID=UPI00261E5184|nr:extracellular solute-binding protein [Enterovirga sp.]MDB5592973.1 extracellular solute-binding protein family 1 [Enterovirga sp.]
MGVDRRSLIWGGAAVAAGALPPVAQWAAAWAQEQPFKPEPGAKLNFLRWGKFLDAEDRATRDNIAAFTKATGVEVSITSEWQDDIQPKVAIAANSGSGPDVVWAIHTTPFLVSEKCLDVTDVAEHVGKKHGGWYPLVEQYGKHQGRWIAIPNVVIGVLPVFRTSFVKAAGFDSFPKDTDSFLKLCQALKASGHPAGFAFGKAPSDGNAFCNWLLWSHGGKVADEAGKVAINSPETVRALDYARALYPTFIEGTLGWNDATNNQAFLGGNVSLTNNSVSVYGKARADKLAFADDIDHAAWPVGPTGVPAEFHLVYPLMVFSFTKYPNAAKAFLTFMMEKQQYDHLLEGSAGYISQALRGYAGHPVWDKDPRIAKFRDAPERGKSVAWPAPVSPAAASVFADFVLIDMFAEVVSGQATPKDAATKAERRVLRHYRG